MVKPMFKKFFPEKVYRCDCLAQIIAFCLANKIYSLMDICQKVNETDGEKIYCVKCGENDQHVVLSCSYHMLMVIFAIESSSSSSSISLSDETRNCCLICIKNYLQKMYHIFGHENFKN